jgi:hypothetical protein
MNIYKYWKYDLRRDFPFQGVNSHTSKQTCISCENLFTQPPQFNLRYVLHHVVEVFNVTSVPLKP